MSIRVAKPEHEVLYQDLAKLLGKHGDKVTAEEMLAIGANMLGKLLAYQDQRTMTRERGLEIIIKNIEQGNQQAVAELMKSQGRA
jgi:sulfur transfer protein SufE